MRQIELLELSIRLKPGEAIKLPYAEIKEAADGNFTGLDLLCGGARPDDVKQFVAIISENWYIDMIQDPFGGGYTMIKKEEIHHQNYGVPVNGVVAVRAKCIGCGEEFDDYLLEGEPPDCMPVCGRCEKTMEP